MFFDDTTKKLSSKACLLMRNAFNCNSQEAEDRKKGMGAAKEWCHRSRLGKVKAGRLPTLPLYIVVIFIRGYFTILIELLPLTAT